jgi:transcriptional regulator with XRE-family HTH domain
MSPGQLIRDARHRAGLSQTDLAHRLGTTQGAIAQLERPDANPTFARLDEALRATGERLVLSAEAARRNVDETLLARNLRLTPAERLRAFETGHGELEELRAMASHGR